MIKKVQLILLYRQKSIQIERRDHSKMGSD